MRYLFLFVNLFIALILIESCSKQSPANPVLPPVDTTGNTPPDNDDTAKLGIYVAGNINDTAVYWRNGKRTILGTGLNASKVFVSGNDIYVLGDNDNTGSIVYWKNGTLNTIDTKFAFGFSIFVTGNDVYIAGDYLDNGHSVAAYWKNGVVTALSTSEQDSYASNIKVNGNDVYVAGSDYGNSFGQRAIYWKNGIATILSPVTSFATDLAISNSDVYVSGQVDSANNGVFHACYWKNSELHVLSNSAIRTDANAICVSGNDVYVAGTNNIAAAYWKNGVLTQLTTELSAAQSITFQQNDVYVGGGITYTNANGTYSVIGTYWKNQNLLTDVTDEIHGTTYIFVK